MILEWCSVYFWILFIANGSGSFLELNFTIGPHVGGVAPRLQYPF
jgi:hypothetical protein